MSATNKEKYEYNGFMIMPYLTKREKKSKPVKKDSSIDKKNKCTTFYLKTIKSLCDELKSDIKRADEIFDEEQNVVSKIIENIKKSNFIIVDLTLLRPNVLYELGIAHCLDPKRTLLITQGISDDEIPFDISNYDRFEYDLKLDEDERRSLRSKIKTLIDYHKRKEICVGVSPFPELHLLKESLIEYTPKYKSLEVPWSQVFKRVSKNKSRIDLIIANKSEYKAIDNPNFELRYISQLITYNSFYIISKGFELNSFKEFWRQGLTKENSLKKTLEQFNEKTIIYIDKNTDYLTSFYSINSIYGYQLISEPIIRSSTRSDETFLDFINSKEPCLFVGGIPEKINLLKNKDYKLIIEFDDVKHINGLSQKLQQENGIIITVEKNLEIKNIKEIGEEITENYKRFYKKIIQLSKDGNIDKINHYLKNYNESDRVKKFKNNQVELTVNADDFIEYYLNQELIHLPE